MDFDAIIKTPTKTTRMIKSIRDSKEISKVKLYEQSVTVKDPIVENMTKPNEDSSSTINIISICIMVTIILINMIQFMIICGRRFRKNLKSKPKDKVGVQQPELQAKFQRTASARSQITRVELKPGSPIYSQVEINRVSNETGEQKL